MRCQFSESVEIIKTLQIQENESRKLLGTDKNKKYKMMAYWIYHGFLKIPGTFLPSVA